MFEKYGPALTTSVLAILYLIWGPDLFAYAKLNGWKIEAMYSAVFDMSSVICAFLFSFLVFVKTTQNKLLDAVRSSKSYKLLIKYMYYSTVSSFVLSLITIPYLITVPAPVNFDFYYVLVVPWVLLVGYVFASVIRSTYNFITVIDLAYGD